jgi:hypothetical protein
MRQLERLRAKLAKTKVLTEGNTPQPEENPGGNQGSSTGQTDFLRIVGWVPCLTGPRTNETS